MKSALLGVTLALVPQMVHAAPSFERLVQSGDLRYRGTMVINRAITVRVVHGTGDHRRQEVVSPKRMKGELVIDNGKSRWHYSPRTGMADFSTSRQWAARATDRLRLLVRNYRMKPLGAGAIAGRSVELVEIVPLRGQRGRQRLWMDREHGLPLKVERLDSKGRLIDGVEYTEISFPGSLPAQVFALPFGAKVASTVRQLASGHSISELGADLPFPVHVPRPPDGFEVVDWRLIERNGVRSVHWRLSDGLSMLSLFQTAKGQMKPPAKGTVVDCGGTQGTLVRQNGTKVLCWTNKDSCYTLVGELGDEELLSIARSSR